MRSVTPAHLSRARARQLPGGRHAAAIALIVATLLLAFGPGLLEHARLAADPWRFNDDARQQIVPLLRYADPALFRGDYITDYYLANLPLGYRLLYALGTPVVAPRTLSKLLPFAELLVVLYALMAAAWRLAGPAAAWGAGALCLSSDVYLGRMSGGLPRSFAFPLVAMAVLALVRGRPWRLCVLTVLGAAFYYPVAALLGLTTAAYLLLIPASWRVETLPWPWRLRVGVLSATAAAVMALTIPASINARPFGRLLGRGDLAAYPETGVGGRYKGDSLPLPGVMTHTAWNASLQPLLSRGPPWHQALRERGRRAVEGPLLPALAGIVIVGYAMLLAGSAGARRLLVLAGAGCAMYGLAMVAWPHLYLPTRYLTYTLPLLTPVLLPASLAFLARRVPGLRTSPALSGALVVMAVALAVLCLGGRGPGVGGLNRNVPSEQRPLYAFIARLPAEAMIAGWPKDVVDNIPYLAARRILVGHETHQVFHERYTAEMRRRMQALIDAYFAGDVGPLLGLRREFGVTHLLVNRDHYGAARPTYFKPFDAMIADALRRSPTPAAALQQAGAAVVFEDGPLVLLDLDRLAGQSSTIETDHVAPAP